MAKKNDNKNDTPIEGDIPMKKSKDSKKGNRPKTEAEVRSAFLEMKTALKNDNLKLQIEDKNGKRRYSAVSVDGEDVRALYGPAAGGTFIRAIEGATRIGPFARIQ